MSYVDFPQYASFFSQNDAPSYKSLSDVRSQMRFSTHDLKHPFAKKMYNAAQILLTPWKVTLRLLGRVLEPLPGENKDCKWRGLAIRVASLIALILLSPIGLLSLMVATPFHAIAHKYRPFISYIDYSEFAKRKEAESKNTLDMRSYNLGFTFDCTTTLTDLRHVLTRAREIVESITKEENGPDVICFQEAFHIDGTQLLCDGIKEKYPHIIHSIAPHGMGLSSGLIIASKYPMREVTFRRFTNLLGPERLSTRGLLGVSLDLGNGRYATVYNVHTQALLGKERAEIRLAQLRQVVKWMDEDHEADVKAGHAPKKIADFLMGDTNLSLINAWGEHNPNETAGAKFLAENFYDPFLEEHDQDGIRTSGHPRWLAPGSVEPTGTWYTGPFANKGLFLRIKAWYERVFNGFKVGETKRKLENPVLWGTPRWTTGPRTANTARFDFHGVRLRRLPVTGIAEIEHVPTAAQSGASDHLPIRALYTLPPVI